MFTGSTASANGAGLQDEEYLATDAAPPVTLSATVPGASASGTAASPGDGVVFTVDSVVNANILNQNFYSAATWFTAWIDLPGPGVLTMELNPSWGTASGTTDTGWGYTFSLVTESNILWIDGVECSVSGGCSFPNKSVTISGAGTYQIRFWSAVVCSWNHQAGDWGSASGSGRVLTVRWVPEILPKEILFSPADEATEVAVNTNLVITFNENMAKGSGNIFIKKSSDNSVVETIDVTSGLVTISGSVVTIDPAGDLENATGYYVQIDSGALTDTASPTPNPYAGISDNTTWNFTTVGDTTPPTVTVNQAVGQGDPTKISPINFTVVFSENVSDFDTGDVTLSGTAGATTAVVTGSGTNYNIAVSGMTKSGTVIASIGAGVAYDEAGNPNDASTSTDNQVTYNLDPTTLTDKLIAIVQGYNLQKGLENSLVKKLQNAQKSLSGNNASQRQDAVNKLGAFINECEAQRNKGLSPEQANTLTARANEIITLLKQ